jgi:hypothetical protein
LKEFVELIELDKDVRPFEALPIHTIKYPMYSYMNWSKRIFIEVRAIVYIIGSLKNKLFSL